MSTNCSLLTWNTPWRDKSHALWLSNGHLETWMRQTEGLPDHARTPSLDSKRLSRLSEYSSSDLTAQA